MAERSDSFIPADAIDAIKTLPYVMVDRMTSRLVALDQVVGLLQGWAQISPTQPDIADAICFVEGHPHTVDEPSCRTSRGVAEAVAARLGYRAAEHRMGPPRWEPGLAQDEWANRCLLDGELWPCPDVARAAR